MIVTRHYVGRTTRVLCKAQHVAWLQHVQSHWTVRSDSKVKTGRQRRHNEMSRFAALPVDLDPRSRVEVYSSVAALH
jgi:hypothetical protein